MTDRIQDCWDTFTRGQHHDAMAMAMDVLHESRAYEAIHIVALSLVATGHLEGADWCRTCLRLADAPVDWYLNCGKALGNRDRWAEAREILLLGREKFPEHQELMLGMATAHCHSREFDECLDLCRILVETSDSEMLDDARLLAFFCLWIMGRMEDSVLKGSELASRLPRGDKRDAVLNNLAMVYRDMGRPHEALTILEDETSDPEAAAVLHNRALVKLGLGHWPEAWHMYQARFNAKAQKRPKIGLPWAQRLEDLRDRNVCLLHEQGLGDCIQFVRYAHTIAPIVRRLVVGVPKQMVRLMQACLGVGEVVEGSKLLEDNGRLAAELDVGVQFLDVPGLLNQRTDNIPGQPYLSSVPWSSWRELPPTDLPKIGVCWAGSSRHDDIRAWAVDQRRSMRWSDISPWLYGMRGRAMLYSLQHPTGHTIDDDPGDLYCPIRADWDMMDTASVVQQLDMVIAVDSAVMHLAAAMQKPVFMPTRHDMCWRWLYQERSDWYPELRIYRQSTPGEWGEPLGRMWRDIDCHLRILRPDLRISKQ